MKFYQYRWSRLEQGATVVVRLSTGANIRLMDSSNFAAYKAGRKHRYLGGLVKKSPHRIEVPRAGTWYLTIDLAGLRATSVRHSATIEPRSLPAADSEQLTSDAPPSLAGIQHGTPLVAPDDPKETWDVFISHASEDKAAVAEPLYRELTELGLKAWLDKGELRIGDSLHRSIDYGLAHSTFGVVILSRHFFAKSWPQYELAGIIAMDNSGEQRMLPIWHEISRDEIARRSPSLVDKIARNTTSSTIADIAAEIAGVVRDANLDRRRNPPAHVLGDVPALPSSPEEEVTDTTRRHVPKPELVEPRNHGLSASEIVRLPSG